MQRGNHVSPNRRMLACNNDTTQSSVQYILWSINKQIRSLCIQGVYITCKIQQMFVIKKRYHKTLYYTRVVIFITYTQFLLLYNFVLLMNGIYIDTCTFTVSYLEITNHVYVLTCVHPYYLQTKLEMGGFF